MLGPVVFQGAFKQPGVQGQQVKWRGSAIAQMGENLLLVIVKGWLPATVKR